MSLINDIHQLQDDLHQQGIIFCYSGYMTEDVLLSMGNTIKQKLEMVDADRNAARAVFAIFVEEAQNVIRYSADIIPGADDASTLRHGFLAIGQERDRYFVCCSNLIERGDVARLSEHLEHIKSLDASELKALYRQTLRGETPKGSKGAGVGFVDIARRAKGGFEFGFKDVGDAHAYFCIKAYV